ncbi:actin-crosslinking protein [Xylariaceae sp. FL0016]|nr:actin-crosslinking protein [Xylariaceae sp. FL0016]
MVKPLSFKGDKKPKKRKRTDNDPSAEAARSSDTIAASGHTSHHIDHDPEEDDSWVSADTIADIVGPVMLVLPTQPPTCLACDANGSVFTDPIANIVDGNPTSAEPHDVRQVWVVNKIYGTDNYRFKGRYGKYLSCDKYGILSATSEAVAPPETWSVTETVAASGTFQLRTQRETFVTIQVPTKANGALEVRGDANEAGPDTALRIRLQARFKPRLKASKESKEKIKVSRKELEEAVGRRLEEDEVRMLKRARREGDYHEQLLDLKSKNKHDKYG